MFEPTVMFFGLCDSPALFCRWMAEIFRDLIQAGKMFIYMDDIIIFGDTQKELEERTKEMLEVARENGLQFKGSKCCFDQEEVPFLGVVVGNGKVTMEEEKVSVI